MDNHSNSVGALGVGIRICRRGCRKSHSRPFGNCLGRLRCAAPIGATGGLTNQEIGGRRRSPYSIQLNIMFNIMATQKFALNNGHKKPKNAKSRKALDIETRSNVFKIAEMEEADRAKRTIGEKIAEMVAGFCGSMTFVYVHIVLFGGWLTINSGLFGIEFDPFPFTFLTLVVSLEAIFLSTFILISQNQETRLTERRNHLDLQINMLAEQESTKTLELLQRVAEKVGVPCGDEETQALLEPMEPGELLKQIESATGDDKEK